MKNSLIKIIALNIVAGITILVMFYLTAFLSGYGSNGSHISMEKKLFIKFAVFHFVINFYLLYRFKQMNLLGFLISLIIIAVFYLIVAWYFEYF
ncbi:MAG: hypothetical protein J0I84_20535 [Terrimonas sp.]|nr:hypothetical protein [Terrimonas sp.]OJY85360.1 MAG: hypothetical protein BGP13_22975 [Sphingobacteriales bacterium 40-81]